MRTFRRIFLASGLSCIPALVGAGLSPSPTNRYTLTDLGTLGGGYSAAYAINANGKVVGVSKTAQGKMHAFFWQFGVIKDLGTLGGAESFAFGVNDKSQVVGWSDSAGKSERSFLWENGRMTNLGLMNGTFSHAYGINAKGHIVGVTNNSSGFTRGFLLADGKLTIVGALGGTHSQALALSDSDNVVGFSNFNGDVGDAGYHAILAHDNTLERLTPEENRPALLSNEQVNLAAYVNSTGEAVSAEGIVAGSENNHATLWKDGRARDLGTLRWDGRGVSIARGINAQGVVVGQSDVEDSRRHAFVWQSGKMEDLNRLVVSGSGWDLTEARAINIHGQIVGSGLLRGKQHAFLLTLRPGFRTNRGQNTVVFEGASGAGDLSRRLIGATPFVDARILQEREEYAGRLGRLNMGFFDSNLLPIETFSRSPHPVLPVDAEAAVESPSVISNGAEFRLCTTAVWTGPPDVTGSPNVVRTSEPSEDSQDRSVNLGFRITNRGPVSRQFNLFDVRTAEVKDLRYAGQPVMMDSHRQTTIPGLAITPVLAPGQTFAFSRLVKLRRIGGNLYLIGSDGFGGGWQMRGPISPGRYSWSFKYSNMIFGPDLARPWWAGTAITTPVEFEIK